MKFEIIIGDIETVLFLIGFLLLKDIETLYGRQAVVQKVAEIDWTEMCHLVHSLSFLCVDLIGVQSVYNPKLSLNLKSFSPKNKILLKLSKYYPNLKLAEAYQHIAGKPFHIPYEY